MPRLALHSVLLFALWPIAAPAQPQHASSDRKTIEISATEKVVVASDSATVKIGYQNLAATKDDAYGENTRTANKIVQAILDAGVPKEAIETESLKLEQEQEPYGAKSGQPAKYVAVQEWEIHSSASEAQKIVDIAVAAGANQIEAVEWSVKAPDELEAKAYAAALNRAKNLAEQTASHTGLKLGEIISIVNSANPFERQFLRRDAGGGGIYVLGVAPKPAMQKHSALGVIVRGGALCGVLDILSRTKLDGFHGRWDNMRAWGKEVDEIVKEAPASVVARRIPRMAL